MFKISKYQHDYIIALCCSYTLRKGERVSTDKLITYIDENRSYLDKEYTKDEVDNLRYILNLYDYIVMSEDTYILYNN